jgi:hypothetical protein
MLDIYIQISEGHLSCDFLVCQQASTVLSFKADFVMKFSSWLAIELG